jgi:preprotein translocase subunit SecD
MLDFPRWKTLGILALTILGCLLAVPSLIPERYFQPLITASEATERNVDAQEAGPLVQWPESLRPRVNLGLDLAGGSHIMLQADIADVRTQRLQVMERNIRTAMRGERGPGDDIGIGAITRTSNGLSFLLRDPTKIDDARERLNAFTTGDMATGQRTWDIEVRDSNRMVMTQTAAGLRTFLQEAMVGARDVIARRVDALGTREPTIVLEGDDRIVVQVPGLQDPDELKALLNRTARLEFRMVTDPGTYDPAEAAQGRPPVGSEVVRYADQTEGQFEVVSRQVMISGDQLENAQQEFDPQDGSPVVSIRFNAAGAATFARVTREGVGRRFAMLIDGEVLSAPVINEPIPSGTAQISGGFTTESANSLAIALKSGALPVSLQIVEERTVSPELGAESIEKGVIAAIVATLLTLGFMLAAYGRFGVYANIALVANIFLIIGLMALFGSTLTLPGIAGFVLTIGAAVDANVLINERIREELRNGRKVVAAIENGYQEASRAIFDANITNVIAAALMFVFGSGPIKGFAVVLTIGIVTSVFTAVTLTRLLVAHWLRKARPTSITI